VTIVGTCISARWAAPCWPRTSFTLRLPVLTPSLCDDDAVAKDRQGLHDRACGQRTMTLDDFLERIRKLMAKVNVAHCDTVDVLIANDPRKKTRE